MRERKGITIFSVEEGKAVSLLLAFRYLLYPIYYMKIYMIMKSNNIPYVMKESLMKIWSLVAWWLCVVPIW